MIRAEVVRLADHAGSSAAIMPIPMTAPQIADDLADRIRAGEYPPGTQLPTYPELAELYGVSVSTMQRAMDRLKAVGWVVGAQGRGLFVAESPPGR
jgi:DNA-binding GntR family transcriptional regulator